MFKKTIDILQNEINARKSIAEDNTGVITNHTKREAIELISELLLAVTELSKYEPITCYSTVQCKSCRHIWEAVYYKGTINNLECPKCKAQDSIPASCRGKE